MKHPKLTDLPWGEAVCYSGYRRGQSPESGLYPSYQEVREDLELLHGSIKYLRLYDGSPHAATVLEVIHQEGFDFRVMLGCALAAEVSNPACPWGGVYLQEVLNRNKVMNRLEIDTVIHLAKKYPEIVFAVSAGNEATVDWNDHMVPVETVIEYVRHLKANLNQPVTFCENYVPWVHKLAALVDEVDFISLHSYPVWEYKTFDEGVGYTQQNFLSVADHYPDKDIMITEAGWTTRSNGRGIPPSHVNEDFQQVYCENLNRWARENNLLTFVFEAFDEPWKGSPDPDEPEKHWGLFTVDRRPKKILQKLEIV